MRRQLKEDCKRTALETILAPLSQHFLSAMGDGPVHIRGASGRFRHLLNWDGLANLLESHHLESPRLCIVKAGQTIPAERYLRRLGGGISRIDGGALSLLLDAGATAIISHVDDFVPEIAAISDEVGDWLGARTAVNLYASWRSDHGFDPHWDSHDILVLQLAGRKQWSIYRPTRPDPLRSDAFQPLAAGTPPERVEMLQDGDLLYLPRGWIHAPRPAGEASLHLTIAITRPTGAGFLTWLTSELGDDPRVRATVPPAGDKAAIDRWKGRLAAIVSEAIEGSAVDRYLTQKDAERGARPRLSFPDFGRIPPTEWNQATLLRPASLNRFIVETAADGSAQLTAMGRTFGCSAAVAATLARLSSTCPLTRGELEAQLSEEDVARLRQLLALLATFGLLASEPS